MAYYNVFLLAADGSQLACDQEVLSLKRAKARAKALLGDPEYAGEAHKAEVHSADEPGCLWDVFARPSLNAPVAPCGGAS